MFERPPNGFFVRDLILFNHLRRGGYVSKGFVFEAPDLTNSPIADLNDFQEQLCLLLASLHENQRLQVQYFSDSDYKSELLRYQQETERFENLWTKRSRNERFARYWQAMTERKLRRQRVVIYVSRSLENVPKTLTSNSALREYYLTLLDQLEMEFTHVHHLLKEIFASAGTRVLPMTDLDHFKHYKTFLNPSLAERFDFNCAGDFQPELSIQENCWHSEGNGQSDFGFYLDGHYHSVIALTRWPRTTYPGIIQRLTNLRLLDYSITVNVDPATQSSWWTVMSQLGSFTTDLIVSAVLLLIGWLASLMMFWAYIFQTIILNLGYALSPLLIGFMAIPALKHTGNRYLLNLVGVILWPLGWALAALVTQGILDFMTDPSFQYFDPTSTATNLQKTIGVGVVGFWIVFSTIAAPAIIQNVIAHGIQPGGALLAGGVSSALQTAATTAGAAASAAPIGIPVVTAGAAGMAALLSTMSSAANMGSAGNIIIAGSGLPPRTARGRPGDDISGDKSVRDLIAKTKPNHY